MIATECPSLTLHAAPVTRDVSERTALFTCLKKLEYEPAQFLDLIYRPPGGDSVVLFFASVRVVSMGTQASIQQNILDEGFVRVAHLLEGSNSIPAGKREDGKILKLSNGSDALVVVDRVQVQEQQQ